MIAFVSLVLLAASLGVYRRHAAGTLLSPTLPNIPLAFWTVQALGSVWIVIQNDFEGQSLITMNALGATTFALGSVLTAQALRFRPLKEAELHRARPLFADLGTPSNRLPVWCIGLFSAGLLGFYTYEVGSVVRWADLTDLVFHQDVARISQAVTYRRKALTSGLEGYWAPGYLKQFRDTLLPVSACLFLFSIGMPRWKLGRAPGVILGVAALVFLLTSGHRAPLFLATAAMMLIGYQRAGRALLQGSLLTLGASSLAALLVLSILLGRTDSDVTGIASAWNAFVAIADRVTLTYPREDFFSRPLWAFTTVHDGSDWLFELQQVLPGTQESMANIRHAFLGGSYEGNSQLSLWPNTWVNGGWPGILVVGFLLGVAAQRLHVAYLRSPSTVSNLVFYNFAAICTPFIMSPNTFLLSGLASLGIYWGILRIWCGPSRARIGALRSAVRPGPLPSFRDLRASMGPR